VARALLSGKHRGLAPRASISVTTQSDFRGGIVKPKDADLQKGAIEDVPPELSRPGESHNRLANQLSHRETDEDIKDSDSDFPEPGSSPEHS
jgi:hypothetical protein